PNTESAAAMRTTLRAEARADPAGRRRIPVRAVLAGGASGAGASVLSARSAAMGLLLRLDQPFEADSPRGLHEDRSALLDHARERLLGVDGREANDAAGPPSEPLLEGRAMLADVDHLLQAAPGGLASQLAVEVGRLSPELQHVAEDRAPRPFARRDLPQSGDRGKRVAVVAVDEQRGAVDAADLSAQRRGSDPLRRAHELRRT